MNNTQKFDSNRIMKTAVLAIFSVCLLPLSGFEAKATGLVQNLSNKEKICIIKEIILKNLDRTPDYIDQETVLDEISQQMNLDPIQAEGLQGIEREREQQVLQKYPMSDEQLKEKYQQEAENLFPLYNIGDEVEVHYLLHNKSFSISGVYYRSDPTHIWIGTKKILRLNLTRKYSIRFDKDETLILRNQFINEKIERYYKKRLEYKNKLTGKDYWIKSGFLFFQGQWITPRTMAETRIKYLNEEIKIRRMHQKIAGEKSLSGRISILQRIMNMIRFEKLDDHPERVFEIQNQLIDFKRRYVESQIKLALQEKNPARARIILQSTISKYPDAVNIAKAKSLLQAAESSITARNQEIQNRITVPEQSKGIRDKIVDVPNKKNKTHSRVSIRYR